MPVHDFQCSRCHEVTEQFVQQGVDNIGCSHCSGVATKVFLRAPMGFVQADICYDSPIDGRPITNKQMRADDLARHGCIPYEPGMKQDSLRRRQEDDAALDKSVEATVDEYFATQPTRKLEKLEQELRAGSDCKLVRSTPDMTKGVVP